MSLEGLTPEQLEKHNQFKEITSYEEHDKDKILRLLNNTNWNLELSISRFFDGNYDDLVVEQTQESDEQTHLQHNEFEEYDRSFSELRQRRNFNNTPNIIQSEFNLINEWEMRSISKLNKAFKISDNWKLNIGIAGSHNRINITNNASNNQIGQSPILFILLLLPKSILFLTSNLFNALGFLFPKFFAMLGYWKTENDFPDKVEFRKPEIEYKTHLIYKLKEKDTQPLEVFENKLHSDGFNELFEDAKRKFTWLLVILTNDIEENESQIIEFFSNDTLINLLKENNINVYINKISVSPESFEIGRTYRVEKLPYLSLVGNCTNNEQVMSSMSIIFERNEFSKHSLRKTVKSLNKLIGFYEPQLIIKRDDQRMLENERLLKNLQDELFEKSLRQDRERKLAKQEKQRLEGEKKLNELKRKAFFRNYFVEKYTDFEKNEGDGMIKFKLNTGENFIKNFHKNETIWDVYVFIEFKLFLIELELNNLPNQKILEVFESEAQSESAVNFESYEVPFKFELVQLFPKKTIEVSDALLESCKELFPKGNVLVEYLDEEPEEDQDQRDD